MNSNYPFLIISFYIRTILRKHLIWRVRYYVPWSETSVHWKADLLKIELETEECSAGFIDDQLAEEKKCNECMLCTDSSPRPFPQFGSGIIMNILSFRWTVWKQAFICFGGCKHHHGSEQDGSNWGSESIWSLGKLYTRKGKARGTVTSRVWKDDRI